MATRVEKMTVSVPRDLIELTSEIAKEKRISRSKVVSACLRELAERRLREKMEDGYKELAKENLTFANDAINIIHEVLPDLE